MILPEINDQHDYQLSLDAARAQLRAPDTTPRNKDAAFLERRITQYQDRIAVLQGMVEQLKMDGAFQPGGMALCYIDVYRARIQAAHELIAELQLTSAAAQLSGGITHPAQASALAPSREGLSHIA